MPDHPSLPYTQQATLEELAGVGKNLRFDDALEDEEVENIEVVCRKLNLSARSEEDKFIEIPLAKPARAFYFGDRNLYEQEAKRFDQGEKERILNADQFPRNLRRFEDLKRSCQRGFVVPFVGAGMSKNTGCPEWREYLLNLCPEANLDPNAMRERLEMHSDFEGVTNDLVTGLGLNRFNLDFERDFHPPNEITGAITLLPKLFDNSAITTNFDRVLEKAYENDGKAFVEKVTGRGQASAFFRAIPAGERYLLKLHGNLDNAAERVLDKAEYDIAYGNDGNIHFEFPLPKLLKRLFTSYSFLFLGCSLVADRTIQTLMRVAQLEGQDSLPHHYALIGSPSDPNKKTTIDARLAEAHISPIWFPEGEFQRIEEILQLLLE